MNVKPEPSMFFVNSDFAFNFDSNLVAPQAAEDAF
jgi:hypothetical protein